MPPKADEIVEAVQSDIVAGRLRPGLLLRQEELARGFRVSRTPVREALRRLDATGFVALIPNRGARVRDLSLEEIGEAFIVRAELESLAAELAATSATREQQRRLKKTDKDYARVSQGLRRAPREEAADLFDEWVQANDRFHDVITEASQVRLLAELVPRLRRPLPREPFLSPRLEADVNEFLRLSVRQHRALCQLIETGTSASARAVMRDHVELAAAFASKLVEAEDADTETPSIIQRMAHPFYLRGSE